MTQPLFLSADGRGREAWLEAFPDLALGAYEEIPSSPGLVWALQPAGQGAANLVQQLSRHLSGRPLVILADEPNEDEALAALAAGAAGYCNGHAAPEVLCQVATVVAHGGVWVGQGLLQRLLSTTTRLFPPDAEKTPDWQDKLTPRECETALLLAKGGSNKEIARQLEISERTVKAHVGAILEKLGARDRLQLSLIINGVDVAR